MTISLSAPLAAPTDVHSPNGIAHANGTQVEKGAAKLAWAAWVAEKKAFYAGEGADPGNFSYSGLDYS